MTKYIVTGIVLGGLIILAIEFWPIVVEPGAVEETEAVAGQAPIAKQAPVTKQAPAKVAPATVVEDIPSGRPELEEYELVVELPEYADSDDWLERELGEQLDGLPPKDRIARGVAFMASASSGSLNKKNWPTLSKFPVTKMGEEIWLDPKGFARFEPWLQKLEAVSPERLATIAYTVRPWATEALKQIGDPRSIDDLIRGLCQQIESAPVITTHIELTQPNGLYEFKDANLERLSDVHKQFLRIGPQRTIRLQSFADAFIRAYDSLVFGQGDVTKGA